MERSKFNGLIFNPHGIPDQELVDYFATNEDLYRMIGRDSGILGSLHTDTSFRAKQIRYTLFMYDKGSPLWKIEPDVQQRKRRAAIEAGFDLIKQQGTLDQMYLLQDTHLAHSVSAFIVYQHSNTLGSLIAAEQTLHELQSVLMLRMDDFKDDKQKVDHFTTKTKLLAEQKKIVADINEYRDTIWHDDKDAEDVTMEMKYNRKRTPENIALHELKKPRVLRIE